MTALPEPLTHPRYGAGVVSFADDIVTDDIFTGICGKVCCAGGYSLFSLTTVAPCAYTGTIGKGFASRDGPPP